MKWQDMVMLGNSLQPLKIDARLRERRTQRCTCNEELATRFILQLMTWEYQFRSLYQGHAFTTQGLRFLS